MNFEFTKRFTEAGSYHLNVEPLPREHRYTHTEKDTEPTIYRSQQWVTRSGLRAGTIKGVVTGYNTTIKDHALLFHVIIKYV